MFFMLVYILLLFSIQMIGLRNHVVHKIQIELDLRCGSSVHLCDQTNRKGEFMKTICDLECPLNSRFCYICPTFFQFGYVPYHPDHRLLGTVVRVNMDDCLNIYCLIWLILLPIFKRWLNQWYIYFDIRLVYHQWDKFYAPMACRFRSFSG